MRHALAASLLLFGSTVNGQQVKEARIEGSIVDEKGIPIEGATVRLNRYTDAQLDPLFPKPAVTDNQGRYTLRIQPVGADRVTLREVWAEKAGFVRGEIDPRASLGGDDQVDVSFILRRGEVLKGRIEAGIQRSGSVSYLTFTEAKGNRYSRLADRTGNFAVVLPPGVYTITARGPVVRGRPTETASGGHPIG